SRRRHTRSDRDWSSDVCSSDLAHAKQHRVSPDREACLQTTTRVCKRRANQKSRSISANVSGIHPAAGKILGSRSERARLARQMEKGSGMESAFCEVVRRRQTQHLGKLFGS